MACSENPASQDVADFNYPYYFFDYEQILSQGERCYDFAGRDYVILHKPLNEVLPLSIDREGYDAIPNLYALLDSSSMESAGIRKVFEQPALGNKGRGTILGIIDTGIDYRSPLFRNPDGTTRILGIWDQTIEGEGLTDVSPLDAIHYGTFYTEEQINEALQSSDPLALIPSADEIGHGTQMAAIAAGSDTAIPDFIGAAPEAKLVIVRLKQAKQYLRDFYLIPSSVPAFQENDIMVGVKYLLYVARNYQMPLTILLGLGTNAGSHEGALPLATYLTRLSSVSGLIIVVAGGNETGRGHHYLGQIGPGEAYEDVEVRVGPEEHGFTLELWARESELYSVGFFSPAGEEISRLPAAISQEQRITFLLSDTIIHVTYSYSQAVTGSQLILMRFEKPTAGIWRIRVFNAISLQGNFHMWLPVNDFISENTYFLRSNPDTLITDPGNAAPVITTAAYNHRNGSIYIHSSRGYSRTGAIKPDLAAPGVDITGSEGQLITGTSIAAAHMAGACASLLAWASAEGHISFFNTPVAKALLIRGAGRRAGLEYPNREWGYGTLDLYNAFLAVRG
ncbi:MAG: S8 family peptidase [Clostridiaceae bacterium]|nr:S8 family peptidase [Clostridiaceae bacterium]